MVEYKDRSRTGNFVGRNGAYSGCGDCAVAGDSYGAGMAKATVSQTQLEVCDRSNADIGNPLERFPDFRGWIKPAINFDRPATELFVEGLDSDISYTGGKVVSFNVV